MNLVFSFRPFGVDGIGVDTVGIGGAALTGGIPVGTDLDVYIISTQVADSVQGKYLCIDSTFYPPGDPWLWATPAGQVFPYWGGPYCYQIEYCCKENQGDLYSQMGVNVVDLSILVFYVFPPHTPLSCSATGNVDGIEIGGVPVNVADVSYLVNYLFKGGPVPAPCP